MNAYRIQQLAIAAAIDAGEYEKASDILHAGIAHAPLVSVQAETETGYNRTLTAPQKCGIIQSIKRIAQKIRMEIK